MGVVGLVNDDDVVAVVVESLKGSIINDNDDDEVGSADTGIFTSSIDELVRLTTAFRFPPN